MDAVEFKGHRCFKNKLAGFNEIKPVNIIIGRNNTGKTHLLDLVEAMCDPAKRDKRWVLRRKKILDEANLKRAFPEGGRQMGLSGDMWSNHGIYFVGKKIQWEIHGGNSVSNIEFEEKRCERLGLVEDSRTEALVASRLVALHGMLGGVSTPLQGKIFRRLTAERDIRPEKPDVTLALGMDGHGASNIIRKFIHTSHPDFPRGVIQRDLLQALNEIFGRDGVFTEIQAKVHDQPVASEPTDHWEIYLGEAKKDLVPLSNSGSGLKTVLLVLLNLLVIPVIDKKKKNAYVFAFEELENNLHPALLRRLLSYIEAYSVDQGAPVFLTTHSSTALDLFGSSENAQIIYVEHDGEEACAKQVTAHFDKLGVISELGLRPSDLLQANGIIWVEGPSDCVYLNRWIDIVSGGELREGRDYQCAFYGGALLARTQFTSPEEAEADLVNLFRINPNIVVVCDGDRSGPNTKIKDRVRRINREVKLIPNAMAWVTKAREIENYLPGAVISKVLELSVALPDPNQYESFFPRKRAPGSSYLETKTSHKSFDKMELAAAAAPQLNIANMSSRFDWASEIGQIVDRIRGWNAS